MSLYDRNLALLDDHAIPYREVSHEAVLDYPTAHAVRQRFGLRGVESKSLFLRLRGGGYAMLVTLEGARADWAQLKALLGARLLSVRGRWEQVDGVQHLIANQLQDMSDLLGTLQTSSRDFH